MKQNLFDKATFINTWHAAFQKRDFNALSKLFADDVTLYSPAIFQPKQGKEVLTLLRVVFEVFKDYRVTQTFQSENRVLFEFSAAVGEYEIQGIDSIVFNTKGLIQELKVFIRPLSGLTALAKEVGSRLSS